MCQRDMNAIPDSEKDADASLELVELCRRINKERGVGLDILDGIKAKQDKAIAARKHECWQCKMIYPELFADDSITGRKCPNCGCFEFSF